MFKRLHTNDEILEVLLTKKQPMAALRFMRSHKELKMSPSRILDLSVASEDLTTFFTVFKYFEQNKMLTDPASYNYIDKFKQTFKDQAKS